ncbi:hypothetical protein THF1C08_30250 [Vibrio jasicida]|uniref:Uncharacterized protein n=1 Tax=Vibrio jasicida TaxID=766224 RepID=A0AAU9QR98_9VIBR|nr:hypothetical protein THF1C08_30250 [Vibrio jasicida]CAH1599545.1 hypothetical protein THF1A12_40185 [Vibrio jasicida]
MHIFSALEGELSALRLPTIMPTFVADAWNVAIISIKANAHVKLMFFAGIIVVMNE